jgi:3',5'-nucleoside bisphosphate phosphatase
LTRLTSHLTLAPDASIDLHMHTMYSDGRWPAQQLIDYLVTEHFDLVSITDHDRVDTVAQVQALAAAKNLPVLAGVEVSTEWNGKPGHILCYGFDPEQNELLAVTQKTLQLQLENTYEVNAELRRQSYEFPRQQEILASHGGKLNRPFDNALLLHAHEYVPDIRTAMQIIRAAGFHSIVASMAETVEAAHRSKAICILAHPGRHEAGFTFYDIDLLDQLRAEIPIDGIEVYHPKNSKEMVEAYQDYVHRHDLLISTGSDAHCFSNGVMPTKYRAEISQKLLERLGIQVA